MGRGFLIAALAFAMLGVGFPLGASRAAGISPDIVVSQVYGGGGNSGAAYKNDFIELFNRGTAAVAVTGWSVQYASAAGSTWQKTNLAGLIQPGQYYLVQEAAGAGGTVDLPTPDATGAIAMSATAGKVALVTNQTLLTCGATAGNCFPNAAIWDFVGYGAANNFEDGTAAPTLTNTTAALRKNGGCTETDNNGADFSATAPAPRNTASPTSPCPVDLAPSVSATTPANGGANTLIDANIVVTFSENVTVTGAWYSIVCATSGTHTATVSGGPSIYTLDPTANFASDESCSVAVYAAQVTDQDVIDPPDSMAADYAFSFTTIAPATPIHDIQGASHISTFVGTTVKNVPGIVTAKRSTGFYMQDPAPDADPATSEAIFVFTSSAAANVGDAVSVKGVVQEFRPGGAGSTNLTTTELGGSGLAVTVFSSGNALPAPTVIGTDRTPPTETIENDAAGDVETSGVFDPSADGIDFWESLEAMRLQLNDPTAVGPTNSFGETPVIVAGGLRTARGGIVIRPNDFNPERIVLDDIIVPSLPIANVGDHYVGAVVGVLDYNFGLFMLEVTAMPTLSSGGIAREATTAAAAGQLAVATFNVENLSPGDSASKFTALAQEIVVNLRAPDVVAVEEVQDNNGATNDSVVDASETLNKLISAIQVAGGPTYQYREIDPVDDQDGGQPGGNIRQAFLFRTDRGLSFVDRPGGSSTASTDVTSGPGGPELTASPGRIDPNNSAFASSRKPLAGEFLFNARRLFIVANHFNSKGGDQPLLGRFQPPTRISEAQRLAQANVVSEFVSDIFDIDPHALVAVIGDLNDFEFADSLAPLRDIGLTSLISTLPENERYTYVFEGNSQTLDQVMASPGLLDELVGFDSVHVNAEFADQISDHDPQVARFGLAVTASALCSLASALTDTEGIRSSLCAKLAAAEASGARGDLNAEANQIAAFIHEVKAQAGKAISELNAAALIALAGLL